MRILIIVLLSFISFTGYGQTIVKGAGILYTSGVPSHDPGAKGSEVAIDTLTNSWYQWTGAAWVERGFTDNQVISIDSVAGSSVNHYTATLEDGGTIKWRDSFPACSGSDNQLISIDSISGSSVKYYTATLEDGGTISWRDSFPAGGGGITGSGTTGYVPYFTGASAIGNSGMFWDNANSRLGRGTTAPYSDVAIKQSGESSAYNNRRGLSIASSSTESKNMRLWVDGANNKAFIQSVNNEIAYFPLFIQGQGGNTNIGTTTDQGYKLYVSGTFRNSGQQYSDVGFQKVGLNPAGVASFNVDTDTDSGISFPSLGQIELITDGVRMISVNEPNVGIGQTTPTARLHVTGAGSSSLTELLLGEKSDGVDVIKANNGGQVAIGAGAYTTSTVLDVQSTNAVLAPPRMTTAQRDLIPTPPNGGIIFCTDCTATDGSTGVSQTYSSSAWRNHY